MLPSTAFYVGFVRQLILVDRPLFRAIKHSSLEIETDKSFSVRLTCKSQNYPVLIKGLSKITGILLSLGSFSVIRIWDGDRLDEYRIKDLLILDSTIKIPEGVYDRALLEEQLSAMR